MTVKNIKTAIFEFIKKIFCRETLTCNLCGREIFSGKYFCDDCLKKLPFNNKYVCNHCGRELAVPEEYCNSCKQYNTHFDRARSVFLYEGAVRKTITDLKYRNRKYLAGILASYMLPLYIKSYFNADFIVFIPMTAKKQRKRGYNQAELIAREFSERCGIEVKDDIIYKRSETESQVGKSREERQKNLSGSFGIRNAEELENKTVLLIDDVLTTGTTADTVSELFKKKGAKEVFVLTAASVQTERNK